MRQSAFHLAHSEGQLFVLLSLPSPLVLHRDFPVHRVGKFADTGLVQQGPELHDRHGAIKQNVQSAVVGIIKTFQVTERLVLPGVRGRRTALRLDLTSPESAAIGQIVELIKQHAAIPSRLGGIVHVGRLPLVNRPAPTVLLQ